jgi:maltose alpha-D-glucosyltransferase/alpha-amylase
MLRSIAYAAERELAAVGPPEPLLEHLERWAEFWESRVSAAFLAGYLGVDGIAALLPSKRDQFRSGLELFEIDKAAYELRYELNNRPDWIAAPLAGLISRASARPSTRA